MIDAARSPSTRRPRRRRALAVGVVLGALFAASVPSTAAAGGSHWEAQWWFSCEAQLHDATDVPDEFSEAWASNDARRFAREFSHDGTLVDDRGNLWSGRRAIQGRFEGGFATALKGTYTEFDLLNARCISPDVAVVHTTGGVVFPPDTEPLNLAIQTWTLIREARGWQVANLQTTEIDPEVGPPTPSGGPTGGDRSGHKSRAGRNSCYRELDEISEVPLRVVDAWEANDAAAFASVWTPKGTLVVGGGQYLVGRRQIKRFMIDEVFGPAPGITATAEVIEEECVTPDVAVLQTAGGLLLPGETEVPPERQGTQSWVIVRHEGEWLINAYQNTRIYIEPAP